MDRLVSQDTLLLPRERRINAMGEQKQKTDNGGCLGGRHKLQLGL